MNRFLCHCARVSSVILAVSLPAAALALPEIDPGSSIAPLALCVSTFVVLANRRARTSAE